MQVHIFGVGLGFRCRWEVLGSSFRFRFQCRLALGFRFRFLGFGF